MKAKINILIILSLFFLVSSAHAATIYPLKENLWSKFLRCGLKPSCYKVKFGATITTINGTDLIKDSRAVINTNFSNLNSGKIEVGTTSVASITTLSNLNSIGTITTGVWNGTAIGVGYGGTGTTSPSQYQVILGNGSYGLTIASSTGTSGQFLISNGAGAYPSWQTSAIDQSLAYNWTGKHTFGGASTATTTHETATSFRITANSPIRFGSGTASTTYNNFPTVHNASSSVFMNDGNGNVTWYPLRKTAGIHVRPANSTGAVTITHGMGITPQRISFTAYSQTANGGDTFTAFSKGYIVTATSTPGATPSLMNAVYSCGNDVVTVCGVSSFGSIGGQVVYLVDGAGNLEAAATATTITPDSFVINWGTNTNEPSTAMRVVEWEAE